MAFKCKPDGEALVHHPEFRAADRTVWRYRGAIFRYGMDPDDVRSDIIIHLLSKRHLYDPQRAKLTTWCWFIAKRYAWRLFEIAEMRFKHMRHWRPPPLVYDPPDDRDDIVAMLHRANLTDREREWLAHWCNGKSLRQISAIVGVSAERVRQIIAKAIKKMRMQAKRVAVKHRIPFNEMWGTV